MQMRFEPSQTAVKSYGVKEPSVLTSEPLYSTGTGSSDGSALSLSLLARLSKLRPSNEDQIYSEL